MIALAGLLRTSGGVESGTKMGKILNAMIGSTYAGTVTVMFVMWVITVALQAAGFSFIKDDHLLISGALILALKTHSGTVDK